MTSQDDLNDRVYEIGSAIPQRCFQIIPGIIFGTAMISAVARSTMRYLTRRPLYWDDLALAIGVASFITATVLLYLNTFYWYLAHALQQDPVVDDNVPDSDFNYLVTGFVDQWNAWMAITWTTVFCVKASFLIISKQLLQRLSWLNIYFWFVVGLAFVSWALVLASPFIPCPVTGFARINCDSSSRTGLLVGFQALVAGLDVLTDIMIASIPIIILWRSQLDAKQKLVVGPFLCLSLVMIVFSIVRVVKSQDIMHTDFAWMAFWQYLEAGVAIIVTSVTTIRTVFTARKHQKSKLSASSAYSSTTSRSKSRQQDVTTLASEEENHPATVAEPCEIMVENSWHVSYAPEKSHSSETSSEEASWPSEPTTFFRW